MQHVEQKVALVTGGSTGIGAAIAQRLAESGVAVLITGRHADTLKKSAEQHRNIGYFVADVAVPHDVDKTLTEVKARHGRLDMLVNNAGIAEIAPLAAVSSDHVRRILDVNVGGLLETTRLALPLLKQSKGSIVNIASIAANQPFANMSVYSASKAAVVALTRAWAKELAPDGIRVNAVSPGPIETPIFAPDKLKISESELAAMGESLRALVPLKRFGKADEVAEVVGFLLSPGATYVTGAEYAVGGGMEA